MNLQDVTAHIEGLNQKLINLRAEQGKFLAAQSIDTQIAKSQKEINESKGLLETEKSDLKKLKSKKSDSLKFTMVSLEEKITEMLPGGNAVVKIEDGAISIGWQLMPDNKLVEYESLSEGQQKMFDQALTRAMLDKGGLLIYEAATIDPVNLKLLMMAIKTKPYQIIINSWKKPQAMKGWTLTLR